MEDMSVEALENVLDREVAIGSIHVNGAVRSRGHFLAWVLELAGTENTFGSVLEQLSVSIAALKDTDAFEAVDAYLDESDQPGQMDVVLTVAEKPRSSLTIGTQSGGHIEGTTVGGIWNVRNVFGRLETLRVAVGANPTSVAQFGGSATGTSATVSTTNYSELEFTKPFLFSLYSSLGVRGFSTEEKSSYSVARRGGDITVNLPLGSIGYEGVWREVGQAPDASGTKIREECGHSFKSAIKVQSEIDLRDDPISPTLGLFGQVKAELAGVLGGDVRHFSHEYEGQVHLPLGGSGIILNTCAKLGAVHKTSRDAPVHIVDRFFVGGPGSLRGFRRRGVGDHDGADPLGSTFYSSLFVGLAIPVAARGILHAIDTRAHVWGTVGEANSFGAAMGKLTRPGRWMENTRASVGFGLSAALPMGRLEVNWCHVLKMQPSDREKNGIQLGLTKSFG